MPIIKESSYSGPPLYYLGRHFETIVPSLFRKITGVNYERERIDTPDQDFLDLDWSREGNPKLLVVSHGLEGNSYRHYALALVKLFNQNNYDVLVWNNRSCSGEMNISPRLYHHGASDDLKTVISHVRQSYKYTAIYLAGISMGGAQTLKYLGEEGTGLPFEIKGAAVYSTPCNLSSSAATLKLRRNSFYKNKFLKKLKAKISAKGHQFPGLLPLDRLPFINDFDAFDTFFTAPLHGFKDANDFYLRASPDNVMEQICVPTLIVNAQNDPLLGPACYPIALANKKDHIFLEMPKRGGHSGFILRGKEFSWVEFRMLEFLGAV